MSDDLLIEIGAKVDGALAGLQNVDTKVGHLGDTVKTAGAKHDSFFSGITGGIAKVGLLAGPVGLAAGLIGDLGGKLVEASKAADEEQIGMNRLYTTMQANVKGWDGNTDAVEAYIAKQQELAFGDDQLRDSLNILVGQTHNLKDAQNLQTTAMDLARAKNIDLQTASKLVGKVDMDNLAALKKLGIQVTEHMTKEQALAAIRQQTAGQAAAYANTTEGAMTRLQTNMGNVLESVGHTILPKITEALGGLANFMASDAFQGAINVVIGFIGTAFDNFGKIVEFVKPILATVGPILQTLFGYISGGEEPTQAILAAFDQLPGPIQMIGNILNDVWVIVQSFFFQLSEGKNVLDAASIAFSGTFQDILDNVGGLIGQLLQKVGDALPGIVQQIGKWAAAFIAWVAPMIPPLLLKLGELLLSLGTWLIGTALPALVSKLGEWGKAFIDWIGPKIPPMLAKLGELLGSLANWALTVALPTILGKLAQWAGAFIAWVAPLIPPLLLELGKLLVQLGGWLLTTALPAIVAKLVEWGGAFLGWVAKDVLPKLPGVLGSILKGITDWVGGILRDVGNAAGQLGAKMVDGIKSGINNAWSALIEWLKNLLFNIPVIGGFIKSLWEGNTPSLPGNAPSGGEAPINTGGGNSGAHAKTVGTRAGTSSGYGYGNGDIVIQIDGREIGRAMAKHQALVFGV